MEHEEKKANEYIGNKVREHKERKGLSTRELSKRLGISHSYLSRMENGKRVISAKRLEEISSILDVPIQEFYPDSHKRKVSTNEEEVFVLNKTALDLEDYSNEEIIEWLKVGKELAEKQKE